MGLWTLPHLSTNFLIVMNHLATLPPKKRFYAALVCLPLIYAIFKGLEIGLPWAIKSGGVLGEVLVVLAGVVAAARLQHIAAAIVGLFERR
jgi:hypothetical protein